MPPRPAPPRTVLKMMTSASWPWNPSTVLTTIPRRCIADSSPYTRANASRILLRCALYGVIIAQRPSTVSPFFRHNVRSNRRTSDTTMSASYGFETDPTVDLFSLPWLASKSTYGRSGHDA
eukprot:31276-Pelagococcus_subviridis.AAC.5